MTLSEGSQHILSPGREALFDQLEGEMLHEARVYRLTDRFPELPQNYQDIYVVDVTEIPGCHYGLRNVFVPIIRHLERTGVRVGEEIVPVTPDTAILVEPSTGNGWVASSDAATRAGYEHIVVMPDGLPEARGRHPDGREVMIIRTPAALYARGMPRAMGELISQNRDRRARGDKIYVSPNHPIGAADITIEAMSELGRQALAGLEGEYRRLVVVVSMGNGASLWGLAGPIRESRPDAYITATESFACGTAYEEWRTRGGLHIQSYQERFGIEPATKEMMEAFSLLGTNAPIGVILPLQERAYAAGLVSRIQLVADDPVLAAYRKLRPGTLWQHNANMLPNLSDEPEELQAVFGNSTLANIAAAADESMYWDGHRAFVVMAYDGRSQYM